MTFCSGGPSAGLLARSFISPRANQSDDRSVPARLAGRNCGLGFRNAVLEYEREVLCPSLTRFRPPGSLAPPIRLIFLTRVRYIARLEMRFSWKKSNCA